MIKIQQTKNLIQKGQGSGNCPASRQLGLRCKLSWVLCGSSGGSGSGSGGFIYPPHIEPPIFVSSEPVGRVINSYQ